MKRWKAQHALIAAVVLFLSGRASAQGTLAPLKRCIKSFDFHHKRICIDYLCI